MLQGLLRQAGVSRPLDAYLAANWRCLDGDYAVRASLALTHARLLQ